MRRLTPGLIAFVGVTLLGAAGIFLLEDSPDEHWTFVDALYQSVITVTTVGLTEAHELNQVGRLFTIVLAVVGFGVYTYMAAFVAQYLITGELQGIWGRRRMQRRIDDLHEHFIVCGFGRMGHQVAGDLRREKHDVVVIDLHEDALQAAVDAGYSVVHGDAGNDNVLERAGIKRARSLLSVIDSDAENIMVTLSARALNEKLFIIARANAEMTESKLISAGANRVIWPYGISGRRMAQMAVRPNVVEFLEFVTHDRELELWLEELTVAFGSALDGSEIGGAAIREKTGANVVAMRLRTDEMVVSPPPTAKVQAGDILIALGTREQLRDLRELAFTPKSAGTP